MPRGPRLDGPNALHHVIVRGIEGRLLFLGDADRQDFLDRLASVVTETGLSVLAWTLLPNHAHLLVRTGARPLATAMASLLTGYAGSFNRRHHRAGRLFQNRYKSILVEEEPYLLELVRYIHLNLLRAGLVRTVEDLDRFPWSGHSALVGSVRRTWQDIRDVLGLFGGRMTIARRRYREYLATGISRGRRSDLQGGGLRRSAGGWESLQELRRGREHGLADERVLGSGAFVEEMLCLLLPQQDVPSRSRAQEAFPALLAHCAQAWGVTQEELRSGSRRRVVAHPRAVLVYLGVRHLGLPAVDLAHQLSVSVSAIFKGVKRGPDLLRRQGVTEADLLPTLKTPRIRGR